MAENKTIIGIYVEKSLQSEEEVKKFIDSKILFT